MQAKGGLLKEGGWNVMFLSLLFHYHQSNPPPFFLDSSTESHCVPIVSDEYSVTAVALCCIKPGSVRQQWDWGSYEEDAQWGTAQQPPER